MEATQVEYKLKSLAENCGTINPSIWDIMGLFYQHIDGLVQERPRNALELRLSCTNPSI